jgi:predicted lipid-binding transport protein (Tim44 family)
VRKTLALFAVVLSLGMTTMAFDAEAARRLGGGKSAGMQRQNVTPPATAPGSTSASPSQAAPAAGTAAAAAPAAAAAATKRSWMGPIAGIAAGLGLAALASHLGLGEAFGNMLMIGLLVMGALLVVGMVMRKRAAAQAGALAGAYGRGNMGGPFAQPQPQPQPQPQQAAMRSAVQPQGSALIGSGIGGGLAGGAAASTSIGSIPADFDAVGFARNAQDQFMALQAANDAGDLDRLRGYLTPEMLETVKAELAARGDVPQQTQVFGLNAQVVNVVEEGSQYVVSVRFMGSVRDEAGAVPEDLDEIWHLTKPKAGMGGWVIAGIQQGK